MMGLGGTAIVLVMLGGIAVLVADIYAIIQTLQSGESGLVKAIWAVLIIMMPVLGLIIWFMAGPRQAGA